MIRTALTLAEIILTVACSGGADVSAIPEATGGLAAAAGGSSDAPLATGGADASTGGSGTVAVGCAQPGPIPPECSALVCVAGQWQCVAGTGGSSSTGGQSATGGSSGRTQAQRCQASCYLINSGYGSGYQACYTSCME